MRKLFFIYVNICFLFLFLFIIEVFSYHSLFVAKWYELPDYNKFEHIKDEFKIDNHPFINYQQPKLSDPIHFENDNRSFVGSGYKGAGILLLGDSYTYGLGLKKEETFGWQLSKYLKRPVYNWGWCTEGIEYSLFELKNPENIQIIKSSEVKPPLEYAIYTYTYNQIKRLVLQNRQYRYNKLREFGLLGNQRTSVFDKLYFVQVIKNKLFLKSLQNGDFEQNMQKLVFKYLVAVKNEVLKNFPNTKFIVLVYSDDEKVIKGENLFCNEVEMNIINSKRWRDLEKEGITVIKTEELLGRKMRRDEIIDNERTITIHPNGKAWSEIIPKLCDRLSL